MYGCFISVVQLKYSNISYHISKNRPDLGLDSILKIILNSDRLRDLVVLADRQTLLPKNAALLHALHVILSKLQTVAGAGVLPDLFLRAERCVGVELLSGFSCPGLTLLFTFLHSMYIIKENKSIPHTYLDKV